MTTNSTTTSVEEIAQRRADNFRELGNEEWRGQYGRDVGFLLAEIERPQGEVELLFAATCSAVGLLNGVIHEQEESRQAHNILRQALVDYADLQEGRHPRRNIEDAMRKSIQRLEGELAICEQKTWAAAIEIAKKDIMVIAGAGYGSASGSMVRKAIVAALEAARSQEEGK